MEENKCNKFDSCNAPMCPENECVNDCTFFPGEDVCIKYHYEWIKRQRKIASKTTEVKKYYTYEMLNQNCIIGSAMAGLDPAEPEGRQLAKWFENHPVKKELSETQKKARVKHLRPFKKGDIRHVTKVQKS